MGLLLYLLQWITGIIIILMTAIYLFYKHKFNYWKKLGIPHTQNPTFPFGDFKGVAISKSMADIYAEIYKKTKNHPFCGFWSFYVPAITVNDPELIRHILVKEFNSFADRGAYVDLENDPLSGHLVKLDGTPWKNLRVKLSPTFTSGKMKFMYPVMNEIAEELVKYLNKEIPVQNEFECKDLMARFTTDIISSCAFGVNANSINDPKSTFREMGIKVVEPPFSSFLADTITFFAPKFAKLLKLRAIGKDVEDFFFDTLQKSIDLRKKEGTVRNDFLQLLIQLMEKGYLDDTDAVKGTNENEQKMKFTFNEAAAQAFVFFAGGFETSSLTLQFALYELSKNVQIQTKLREEVDRVLAIHNNQMTYDAISEMVYLGQVVDETLRMYPPFPILLRVSRKDVRLPDTTHTIPKGIGVHINVCGLHHDEQYYPNPEMFDPDRFTTEEKSKRSSYVYLPFGDGPRNCIGNRFGLLQVKLGLAKLVQHFNIKKCNNTPVNIDKDPKKFSLTPKDGMFLKIESRH